MRPHSPAPILPPDLAHWQGLVDPRFYPSGVFTATTEEIVTVPFDLLRPGTLHTLKLTLSAEPADPPKPKEDEPQPAKPPAPRVVQVSFGEDLKILEPGRNQLIMHTLSILPVSLTISGAKSIQVTALELLCDQPSKSQPLPYDLIGLEIEASTHAPAFRIGKSKIGQDPLGGGAVYSKGFRIGQSHLDTDRLPQGLPELAWRDICGPAMTLQIRRGAASQGVLPVAQAGTLTVTLKNIDPRELWLRHGLKVRCYHRLTRQLIFTGYLRKMKYEPRKGHLRKYSTCTLEFVDVVGKLAATTRYGVRKDGETLTERLKRLIGDTAPYEIFDTAPAVDNRLSATVREAPLATHLDMAIASVGGAWWTQPDGKLIFTPDSDVMPHNPIPWFIIGKSPLDAHRIAPQGASIAPILTDPADVPPGATAGFTIGKSKLDIDYLAVGNPRPLEPLFTIGESPLDGAILGEPPIKTAWAIPVPQQPPLFTDRYRDTKEAPWYYIDVTPSFDSAEELSQVKVENHTATTQNGTWQDATKTYTATSLAALETYGAQAKTFTATVATPEGAQALADYVLARPVIADPNTLNVNSVQVNALAAPLRSVITRLFDHVKIEFEHRISEHRIYAIENRLTPYTWLTRYYMIQARRKQ
ncbi:hypothetical protein F4555_001340 [Mobiluncus mulieris]|uniref:Uncharacterized protein n=1 Tax=Mobiluncus mulieris TaxID=2052 RepID=A0A8G2HVB3_9ACTO|nr:hypothetical protein [Mobiluncus mulieris]MBB5846544.1 hypothetical protein [Mobiluncus mulieris]MCV0011705.1 hypothetical protein [Mobiluncus mulieris]STO16980.1 Uncharacterised protein [Mobiluncus mulieris]